MAPTEAEGRIEVDVPCATMCEQAGMVVEMNYRNARISGPHPLPAPVYQNRGGRTDRLTPEQRSALMSKVRGRDTAPEMAVRKVAHAMGYRYRLYSKGLPGKPDLVFPRLRKAILVHGCFWHAHEGCKLFRIPSTRPEYWKQKFAVNRSRDKRVIGELEGQGWQVLVVWQCETKNLEALRAKIRSFLSERTTD